MLQNKPHPPHDNVILFVLVQMLLSAPLAVRDCHQGPGAALSWKNPGDGLAMEGSSNPNPKDYVKAGSEKPTPNILHLGKFKRNFRDMYLSFL